MSDVKTKTMPPDEMARRVHAMIRAYVAHKTKARCGKTYDDFEASGYKDSGYRDAVNKVCMDAFLALRGRKDRRDFLAYWTGTVCSVPQFIKDEEFRELSLMLLDADKWEDIKSLAMLALSAHSQPDAKPESGTETNETHN